MTNKRDIYRNIKLRYYENMIKIYKLYKKNLYYYNLNLLYSHFFLDDMSSLRYFNTIYININKNINNCDNKIIKNNYLAIL